jgi:hypothetical protein
MQFILFLLAGSEHSLQDLNPRSAHPLGSRPRHISLSFGTVSNSILDYVKICRCRLSAGGYLAKSLGVVTNPRQERISNSRYTHVRRYPILLLHSHTLPILIQISEFDPSVFFAKIGGVVFNPRRSDRTRSPTSRLRFFSKFS